MVEMLSLVKDWEQADTKTQHTMENVELVEAFENLYLNDENVKCCGLWACTLFLSFLDDCKT